MAFDFPNSPTLGQAYGNYIWDGEKWTLPNLVDPIAARRSIYAAPFDALAYNGMQINGSMEISQERGSTSYGLTNNNATYIQDGWQGLHSTTTTLAMLGFSAYTTTVPSGFRNSIVLAVQTGTASLAAGDFATLSQAIEGYRFARLAWGTAAAQPLTIGFWINTTIAGTIAVTVRNGANNRSYITDVVVNAANTWEYKTLTVPGDTTGAWPTDNTKAASIIFCNGCGSAFRGAANTWLGTNSFATVATTNMLATNGNNMFITGVVVLPGIEAPSAARSPLIMRPYDQELLTCQRYFETKFGTLGSGMCFSASQAVIMLICRAKRATPSLGVLGAPSTYTLYTAAGTLANVTAFAAFNSSSPTGGQVNVSVGSGLVAGNATTLQSASVLSFDARL